MQRRRTVREFSEKPVPDHVIDDCLSVAGSAPSGANQQPWHFMVVTDPKVKHRIRVGAEKEERAAACMGLEHRLESADTS